MTPRLVYLSTYADFQQVQSGLKGRVHNPVQHDRRSARGVPKMCSLVRRHAFTASCSNASTAARNTAGCPGRIHNALTAFAYGRDSAWLAIASSFG